MAGGKDTQRSFALLVALFYGALFVVYGTHIPFMPVWLDWRGLSPGEISIVVAAPLFLRLLVTPVIAMAADHNGAHRRYLIILAWLSLAFRPGTRGLGIVLDDPFFRDAPHALQLDHHAVD